MQDRDPTTSRPDSLAERAARRLAPNGLAAYKGTVPLRDPTLAAQPPAPPAQPQPVVTPPPPPPAAVAPEPVRPEGSGPTATAPLRAPTAQPAAPPPPSGPRPAIEIDPARLRAAGCIAPRGGQSRFTEELRMIKRHLIKTAEVPEPGRASPRVVMVTSAGPREGKTFFAVNLALSLSLEREMSVVLVDADSHGHGLVDLLGVPREPGLSDLLVDTDLKAADTLLTTSIANLRILPPGMPRANTVELLASRRMADLVGQLGSRTPGVMVVIDTPAVLASAEASVLAALAGQVVVVVEKDRTSRSALKRTLSLLEPCPKVGCVLRLPVADMDLQHGHRAETNET
ncbi:MAG: chromosome partitioning ATPase [Solirubrobacterales bacterium]